MMSKKYISIILNGIFILVVAFFMLDMLTSFEVKSQAIKSLIYLGVLILTPFNLIWNLYRLKSTQLKMITSVFPILVLIVILIIGPMKIISSSRSWKTQKILYQNGHLDFKKVEVQMQEVGGLGYSKRTVEVTYLTNLFMIVSPVKKDVAKRIEWMKI